MAHLKMLLCVDRWVVPDISKNGNVWLTLRIRIPRSLECWKITQPTTQCNIPEDLNLQQNICGNLMSRKSNLLVGPKCVKLITFSKVVMFIGPCIIVIVEEWKTNLMSLAILFHFLCAEHVSDINISIIRTDVIHQHSRKLLMMDILMSETCWAHKKWNKIVTSSWSFILQLFSKDLLALLLLLSCPHFWPHKFPDHSFFLLPFSRNIYIYLKKKFTTP